MKLLQITESLLHNLLFMRLVFYAVFMKRVSAFSCLRNHLVKAFLCDTSELPDVSKKLLNISDDNNGTDKNVAFFVFFGGDYVTIFIALSRM